jgi:hypothetical protein
MIIRNEDKVLINVQAVFILSASDGLQVVCAL